MAFSICHFEFCRNHNRDDLNYIVPKETLGWGTRVKFASLERISLLVAWVTDCVFHLFLLKIIQAVFCVRILRKASLAVSLFHRLEWFSKLSERIKYSKRGKIKFPLCFHFLTTLWGRVVCPFVSERVWGQEFHPYHNLTQ